jgi:hypothetical protein
MALRRRVDEAANKVAERSMAITFREQLSLRRQPVLHILPVLRALPFINQVGSVGHFLRRWFGGDAVLVQD